MIKKIMEWIRLPIKHKFTTREFKVYWIDDFVHSVEYHPNPKCKGYHFLDLKERCEIVAIKQVSSDRLEAILSFQKQRCYLISFTHSIGFLSFILWPWKFDPAKVTEISMDEAFERVMTADFSPAVPGWRLWLNKI